MTETATSFCYNDLTPEQRPLVDDNLALISWVLNRQGVPEWEFEDRFQDGYFGLVRAAEKFDPARGFKFSTYAVSWIWQQVQRGRQAVEGINFRYAVRNGTEYISPSSIDHHIEEQGDRGFEPFSLDAEELAVDRAALGETLSLVESVCEDDIDLAIAHELAAAAIDMRKVATAELAEVLGRSGFTIRRRIRGIQERLSVVMVAA